MNIRLIPILRLIITNRQHIWQQRLRLLVPPAKSWDRVIIVNAIYFTVEDLDIRIRVKINKILVTLIKYNKGEKLRASDVCMQHCNGTGITLQIHCLASSAEVINFAGGQDQVCRSNDILNGQSAKPQPLAVLQNVSGPDHLICGPHGWRHSGWGLGLVVRTASMSVYSF